MTREIKFRAWVEGEARFIFIKWAKNAFWFDSYLQNPTELELQQFTGLHDKNGKEIYEGDIVSNPLPLKTPWYFTVKYASSEACYFPRGMRHYEVIGNIYENSDLLK